jgi:hypothetical protein
LVCIGPVWPLLYMMMECDFTFFFMEKLEVIIYAIIIGPKEVKQQRVGENYIMRNFIIQTNYMEQSP